ncbi:MAG TPA: hypothetical protein VH083_21330 [Myxococcales bacterium]|jgi:hypothetical protein|nr:hypothetical protein [Myxococcales bacterium]
MKWPLLLLALALPAAARGKLDATDETALLDYSLTAGKIEKLVKIGERMRGYVKAHPEAKQDGFMKGETIDQRVRTVRSSPGVMEMLKAQAMEPRELVLGMLTMMQAEMLLRLRAQYPDTPLPDNVNDKNLELTAKHGALLEKWRAAWEMGALPASSQGTGQ